MNSINITHIANIALYVIGFVIVVVGSVYANRAVKDGIVREIDQRRQLTAATCGA